jgi:hypothetical protein
MALAPGKEFALIDVAWQRSVHVDPLPSRLEQIDPDAKSQLSIWHRLRP